MRQKVATTGSEPPGLGAGWRLSAARGALAASDGRLAAWAAEGDAAPVFVAGQGLGLAGGEVIFPGQPVGVVRTAAPVRHGRGQTLFGVIRMGEPDPDGPRLVAASQSLDGLSEWRLILDRANRLRFSERHDGQAYDILVRPPEPADSCGFFVVRRTTSTCNVWWNGLLLARLDLPGPRPSFEGPIVVGGGASGVGGSPFIGGVREIGCYDHPLEKDEIEALLDFLSVRMPVAALSWGAAPLSGPYPTIEGAHHGAVLAPTGAEPTESDLPSHRYHHHTRVAVRSGRVWAAFSSGGANEDASGQMVAIASSVDEGKSWSAPQLAVPPQSPWTPDGSSYEPGTRIAYPRAFVRHGKGLHLVSAIEGVKGPGDVVGLALVAVECLDDGRVGPPVRISAADYPPWPGFAPLAHDPRLDAALSRRADLFGCWGGSSPRNPASAWTGWLAWNDVVLVEPATFPLDDDERTLVRLWRKMGPPRRACAQVSTDGGRRFSPPYRSTIPDSPSSIAALRLADGRIALVGNPVDGPSRRDPLFLALFSPDAGELTSLHAVRQGLPDAPDLPGTHKFGGASYPDVAQDGTRLYVSYSIHKETIAVTRIDLASL